MAPKTAESVIEDAAPSWSLFSHIATQFRRNASRTAVEDHSTRYTYERLGADVAAAAGRLAAIELPPQSIVGVLMERSYGYIVAALRTAFAGHTSLPQRAT